MKLYRDLDSQEAIDREYNPSAAVPDAARFAGDWAARSADVRARLDARLGLRYGATREEYLDVFPAGPGAPVHVFIHGGYWRRFSARDHSFVAPALVGAGITVVVPNYALCPAVSIDEIVRQMRAATAWTHDHAADWGADPTRLTVSGHSAGGHLTAMVASTDWARDYDRPADLVKSAVAISGLFDLGPFPYSFLQPMLQLDWGQVRRNSPLLNLPDPATAPPLVAAVGGDESAEFRRQSLDYHEARRRRGLEGGYLELAGLNHFTVVEELERPESPLFRAILDRARG